MAPEILHRVIHGTTRPSNSQREKLTVRAAILYGYTRHRIRWADYPAIIAEPSDTLASDPSAPSVRGTLVTGLTHNDIFRLDRFEGYDYQRTQVTVILLKGEEGSGVQGEGGGGKEEEQRVEADTYVWVAGEERLEEGEWEFEKFRTEKMGIWVGAEEEYRDVDPTGWDVPEPDTTGGRAFAAGDEEEEAGDEGKEKEPAGGGSW